MMPTVITQAMRDYITANPKVSRQVNAARFGISVSTVDKIRRELFGAADRSGWKKVTFTQDQDERILAGAPMYAMSIEVGCSYASVKARRKKLLKATSAGATAVDTKSSLPGWRSDELETLGRLCRDGWQLDELPGALVKSAKAIEVALEHIDEWPLPLVKVPSGLRYTRVGKTLVRCVYQG